MAGPLGTAASGRRDTSLSYADAVGGAIPSPAGLLGTRSCRAGSRPGMDGMTVRAIRAHTANAAGIPPGGILQRP
jgi:hypothetical protein